MGVAQNSSQVAQFALHTMSFFLALAQFALRSMPVFSALAQFAFANLIYLISNICCALIVNFFQDAQSQNNF